MKKREFNYDLLRVLAALAVVLGHVSGMFVETFVWDLYDGLPANHPLFSAMYTTLPRFSVPVFLMLSGAFVLGSQKTADAGPFYRKAWKRIGIPAAAAILFAIIYSAFTGIVLDGTGLAPTADAIIAGAPFYHLWYLPVLFCIYLLAPWIERFRREVSPDTFQKVSWGVLAAGCLGLWLNAPVSSHLNIGEAVGYLGYFMIGYVLREAAREPKKGSWLFIIAGFAVHVISGIIFYRALLSGMDRTLAEHHYIMSYAPLTVIASVLIFIGFSRLTVTFDTGRLAGNTYNIYLIHAFILDAGTRIIRAWKGQRWLFHLDSRFMIPVLTLLLYAVSLGISELLKKCRRSTVQ